MPWGKKSNSYTFKESRDKKSVQGLSYTKKKQNKRLQKLPTSAKTSLWHPTAESWKAFKNSIRFTDQKIRREL